MRTGVGTLFGRRGFVIACICTTGVAACAQDAEAPPGETTVEAEPTPGGYTVRLDSERSDPGQFELSREDPNLRILTGPTGIAYRAQDQITSGDYEVSATFVQYGAPLGYREAYGIFVGGRELEGEDLEYTYLLIRPTGDYLVKRRIGEITETIVDWTPHASVVSVVAEGDEPVNTVSVQVTGGEARFIVNGTLLHSMPASEARPYGVAGLRVNHRLDMLVTDWTLSPST